MKAAVQVHTRPMPQTATPIKYREDNPLFSHRRIVSANIFRAPGIVAVQFPAITVPRGASVYVRPLASNTGNVVIGRHSNIVAMLAGGNSGGDAILFSPSATVDSPSVEIECDSNLSQWFLAAAVATNGIQIIVIWNDRGNA